MVNMVKCKPFQKPKKKSTHLQSKKIRLKVPFSLIVKVIWISMFGIVFLYGGSYVLKNTIFATKYKIEQVSFNKQSVILFDDPYLYKQISDIIKWKNYWIMHYFNEGKILNIMQKQYPIIKFLELKLAWQNSIVVNVGFHDPHILIYEGNLKFGLYNDYLFPLYSWNNLGSGIQSVDLPLYAGQSEDIDGLFFEINPQELTDVVYNLYESFPKIHRMVYLPGAKRMLLIFPDQKKVYFNLSKGLDEQITDFEHLRKYYDGFENLWEVDLGSLSDDKIIVKK